jgi:hypothetical protein
MAPATFLLLDGVVVVQSQTGDVLFSNARATF